MEKQNIWRKKKKNPLKLATKQYIRYYHKDNPQILSPMLADSCANLLFQDTTICPSKKKKKKDTTI
jgi:hypothetical protein